MCPAFVGHDGYARPGLFFCSERNFGRLRLHQAPMYSALSANRSTELRARVARYRYPSRTEIPPASAAAKSDGDSKSHNSFKQHASGALMYAFASHPPQNIKVRFNTWGTELVADLPKSESYVQIHSLAACRSAKDAFARRVGNLADQSLEIAGSRRHCQWWAVRWQLLGDLCLRAKAMVGSKPMMQQPARSYGRSLRVLASTHLHFKCGNDIIAFTVD